MARLADAGRAEDLPQYRFISHPELPRVHRAPGFLRRVWPESLMEVKVCILGPVIASMLGKPTPPQRWEARQVDRQCVQGASPKKDSAAYPTHIRYAAFPYPLACRMPVLTIL